MLLRTERGSCCPKHRTEPGLAAGTDHVCSSVCGTVLHAVRVSSCSHPTFPLCTPFGRDAAIAATLLLLLFADRLNGLQDGVSRIHASRRVFDALKRHGSQLAVLHHIRFPAGADRDDIVINTGTQVCVWGGGVGNSYSCSYWHSKNA